MNERQQGAPIAVCRIKKHNLHTVIPGLVFEVTNGGKKTDKIGQGEIVTGKGSLQEGNEYGDKKISVFLRRNVSNHTDKDGGNSRGMASRAKEVKNLMKGIRQQTITGLGGLLTHT